MCFNNSAQVVCGTPLSYYRENPKRAIRYCVRTLATVVFELVKQNKGPHSVSSAEFTNRFLPDLRVRCRMAHGADFAAVVQASFEKLVDHYARKWLVQNRVCVVEDYGSVSWNQSITSLFDTVDDVEAWLRSLGKEDWWVRENADPGGSGRAIAKADDDFVAGFNLLSVVRNEAHAQPESAAKSRSHLSPRPTVLSDVDVLSFNPWASNDASDTDAPPKPVVFRPDPPNDNKSDTPGLPHPKISALAVESLPQPAQAFPPSRGLAESRHRDSRPERVTRVPAPLILPSSASNVAPLSPTTPVTNSSKILNGLVFSPSRDRGSPDNMSGTPNDSDCPPSTPPRQQRKRGSTLISPASPQAKRFLYLQEQQLELRRKLMVTEFETREMVYFAEGSSGTRLDSTAVMNDDNEQIREW